ncbi:methylmalonyl Co-A mutase-associated GTPase MeaB [uncultured Roseibium sp.]|uniref:methylmalonyl Co-A mutase-associated GTPase MeaB n=1 Tax=uncultured Roseibium sp. TaxID=1936171 RepID=UPI0032168C5C
MSRPFPDLDDLRQGGKLALARMLTRLETEAGSAETARFLDKASHFQGGHVLGLTGPPGVGKSTLTDALIKAFRGQGESVSVLAIDPSSRFTGGALLGDRTRLHTDPEDQQVFVRSMAARDRLGGLSDHAIAAIALLRAVSDRVIVESVGIGQSESDLVQAADTMVLCIQPGSGDSLQFMKAGVMELPDLIVVTKADMGPAARRAASDVTGALSLTRSDKNSWKVPVFEVSARSGNGLGELIDGVAAHRHHLAASGRLEAKRAAQHRQWYEDMIHTRFGTAGLEAAASRGEAADPAVAPFSAFRAVSDELSKRLGLSDI